MKGEIISIGDELLIGQVINTNAAWIGGELTNVGIQAVRITTIADKHGEIFSALEEAASRADFILVTGGLGPTKDDITKKVLCDYFQTELVYDDQVFKHIEALFSGRSLTWNELNRQQAFVPENCTVLPNKNGTAPGMWFEKSGKVFVSLPGVPFEMKELVKGVVIPKLIRHYPKLSGAVHQTVFTLGIPESVLATKIESWENNLPEHIKLAYLPRAGMVRLRFSAFGDTKEILKQSIQDELDKLHLILPGEVFGGGEKNLETVIGNLLKSKNKTLSTAESCTGGFIAHMITSVPGSSEYFYGSVVSYANEIKKKMLGVDEALLFKHGAVSEAVVKAMATGVRKHMDTDYSIATSGIAGPGGGTPEKPVGTTWIAVASAEKVVAKKYIFGKQRERNIQRAAFTALNMLRKEINS